MIGVIGHRDNQSEQTDCRALVIRLAPDLARATRHFDPVEQTIDRCMEAFPRRFSVALVAYYKRVPGIEFLVKHVAPGELRADHVPGEFIELVPLHRLDRRRFPPTLK